MTFDIIAKIGLLLLFATILVSVFNAGTVVACLLTGVKMEQIAVFYGKPVFTFPTRLCPLTIGYIPAGGFVTLDMEIFPTKPLATRCFVTLAGPFMVFLSSLICLGLPHTIASFASTFPQLVQSLVSSPSYSKELIAGFLANAQAAPIAGYGILAAKSAALHLLPLPVLPGGRLLVELIPKRRVNEKFLNYVNSISAVAILIWLAVTVIRYFFYKH